MNEATDLSEKTLRFLTLDGFHKHGKRRTRDLLGYNGKVGTPPLTIEALTMPVNTQLPLTGG